MTRSATGRRKEAIFENDETDRNNKVKLITAYET